MYKSFYGLKEKPFHIIPNPQFLYMSPKHQNALTYLEYGLMERTGFIMLTGEIGTGKTTLIRYILDRVEPDMEVAVIFNTNVSADQILDLILQEFELEAQTDSKAKTYDRLYEFLIEKYSQGKRVLLIIDEAQNLSREALEEIRMLSNLQSDDEMLLQIMIVGQPELRNKLQDPNLTQFAQRVAVSYHLSPLTHEECSDYIAYRLQKAGGEGNIFAPEAVDLIFEASGGIPRTINLLCDAAMVYGYADELRVIDETLVGHVIEDKGGMGLFLEGKKTETGSGAPAADPKFADIAFLDRVATLEKQVDRLESRLDSMFDMLMSRETDFRNEMADRIRELLDAERKKNEQLLFAYGKLKMKLDRQKEHDDNSSALS